MSILVHLSFASLSLLDPDPTHIYWEETQSHFTYLYLGEHLPFLTNLR